MSAPRATGARASRPPWLERIASWRVKSGWTQEATAAVLRVSSRAVYRREAGAVGLRVDDLSALVRLYDIPDEEVVRIVREAAPPQLDARLRAWGRR